MIQRTSSAISTFLATLDTESFQRPCNLNSKANLRKSHGSGAMIVSKTKENGNCEVPISTYFVVLSFGFSMLTAYWLGQSMSSYFLQQSFFRVQLVATEFLDTHQQYANLERISVGPITSEDNDLGRQLTGKVRIQSTGFLQRPYSEDAFYEALIHPVMLAHDNPETVAILGARDCNAIHQVLLHKTVKDIYVIGANEKLATAVSHQSNNKENDTDVLGGRGHSCLRDPRVQQVYLVNPISWFIEHYSDRASKSRQLKFDVIIIDSEDVGSEPLLAQAISKSQSLFVQALSNALYENGATASGSSNDPKNSYERQLVSAGFQALQDYEETRGIPKHRRNFLAAFKLQESRARWFASEAAMTYTIRSRTSHPFQNFDAVVARYPTKISETKFCKQNPIEFGCRKENRLEPERANTPAASFEVKQSLIRNAGRGVFAKVAVAKGSYIAAEECVHSVFIPNGSGEFIHQFLEEDYEEPWETLFVFADGYGFPDNFFGEDASDVDASLFTFVNHGCDGTFNVGSFDGVNEVTATLTNIVWPEESLNRPYNPAVDRNGRTIGCISDVALEDISPGDELLQNYLSFISSSEEDRERELKDLRLQCSRQAIGTISAYEMGNWTNATFPQQTQETMPKLDHLC